MSILLYIFRFHLVIIYSIIKLITIRKPSVFFLSRQSSTVPLNYKMVMDELEKKNIQYRFICKKVDSSINDSVRTHGNYSTTKSLFSKLFRNIKSAGTYYFSLYRQMWIIAQSKVIIVDGYNLPVSLLKHKRGTKVIQMWHALGAIKKFGYQAVGKKEGVPEGIAHILKMHANYDYILSGSKGMNVYFAEAFNTPIENVVPIGTPIVDYIRSKGKKDAEKIYKEYPILKDKVNVLYSPTFRNDKSDNNQEVINNFNFKKCNLIFTNHPKVESKYNDDRVVYIPGDKFSVFDCLMVADYIITDYSALMIDAAIANKRILLYVYDYEKYSKDNGINLNLLKDWSTLAYKDIKDIVSIIDKDKYDTKAYERFKKMYTPDVKGRSTDAVVKMINECLGEKK